MAKWFGKMIALFEQAVIHSSFKSGHTACVCERESAVISKMQGLEMEHSGLHCWEQKWCFCSRCCSKTNPFLLCAFWACVHVFVSSLGTHIYRSISELHRWLKKKKKAICNFQRRSSFQNQSHRVSFPFFFVRTGWKRRQKSKELLCKSLDWTPLFCFVFFRGRGRAREGWW